MIEKLILKLELTLDMDNTKLFECHQDVWVLKKAMSMKMAISGLQNCVQN